MTKKKTTGRTVYIILEYTKSTWRVNSSPKIDSCISGSRSCCMFYHQGVCRKIHKLLLSPILVNDGYTLLDNRNSQFFPADIMVIIKMRNLLKLPYGCQKAT